MATTIDLGAAGFKSLETTGSMAAGSSVLTVATSAGFSVGDSVIIAVGGEAGAGQRGTVGVGGVYAAQNNDPNLYYTNTDAPKALVAKVLSIGSDGHTLILDHAASTSTTGATVNFDNKPVWDAVVAANQTSNVTLNIPVGHFAVSDIVNISYFSNWTLQGAGKAQSEIFSPDGAHSASISVFQANHTTLQDFSLTGNAKMNGFGTGSGETYPPGIMFTLSDNGLAQNLTVTDAFQSAVGTRYSNDTWAKNVDAHLTEGLARYIQWQFNWSNSTGGGVMNSSLDSPILTNGFEAFLSKDVSFIGLTGVNASMSMNSSGNFLVKDTLLTTTPGSWVSDQAFHHNNPLININSNISQTDPLLSLGGSIANTQIVENGYINSNSNILVGLNIGYNNPNINVSNFTYVAPDQVNSAFDRGPSGINSNGQNTIVNGATVIGNGYFNIGIANGSVSNSVAGTINGASGSGNSAPGAAALSQAAAMVAGVAGAATTKAFSLPDGSHQIDHLDATGAVVQRTVYATDGHVTLFDHAPVIQGASAGAIDVYSPENTSGVTALHATDVDGTVPTWSIVGGADAAKFQIGSANGALSFRAAPDYENPTDATHDNVYHVVVRASDGTLGADQSLAVHVTNVAEGGTPIVSVTPTAPVTPTLPTVVVTVPAAPAASAGTANAAAPAAEHLNPVFRFFDTATGHHFYTTSDAEKAGILANQPAFQFEGVAWATPDKSAATVDVFRFFDTKTGDHFFTPSTAERDSILSTLPSYHYEGVAFQAYADTGGAGRFSLERFFNTKSDVHHYSSSASETAGIDAGAAGANWVNEGPGFIVHAATAGMLHL